MEEAKIVAQFSKFVIPFSYRTGEHALEKFTIMSFKGKAKPLFVKDSQKSEGLRQGINDMLYMNGEQTKIADVYKMNEDCRSIFGLPKNERTFLSFYARGRKGEEFKVLIKSVKLFLFESGVGFLTFECGYKSDSMQNFIDCNYYISEIKSKDNYFIAENNSDGQNGCILTEKIKFTLCEFVSKVLSYVDGVEEGDCAEEFKKNKALCYSYLCLDKKPVNLEAFLFNARKNYKASYKFPDSKVNGFDPYVKQQFENSYWGASFNGAVNLSYLVDDQKTNSFFLNDFINKLQDTYFALFIHVLHQRYAILKYIGQMGTLDKLEQNYDIMKKQLKAAKAYEAEVASLKFRAFFKQPSMIEHVNDYYRLLMRTYRIDELYKNFSNDLDNLKAICDVYVSRIKERDKNFENRRKAKIEIFVAIFGTIVGLVTLFNDYWGIIEKLFGESYKFIAVHLVLICGLFILPIVTIVIDVIYRIKDIRKVTKDLNDDVVDGLVEDDKERRLRIKRKHKCDKK